LRIFFEVHESFFLDGHSELIDGFLKLAQIEIFDAQVAVVLHSIEKAQVFDKGFLDFTLPLSENDIADEHVSHA
jgi:hypothetical protein